MTLRARLAMLTSGAMALAVLAASIAAWLLIRSSLLAAFGGLGGAALGGLATAAFATSRDWPFALPVWVLAGAAGATMVVGALAGAYPAARAARMPPTAALSTA